MERVRTDRLLAMNLQSLLDRAQGITSVSLQTKCSFMKTRRLFEMSALSSQELFCKHKKLKGRFWSTLYNYGCSRGGNIIRTACSLYVIFLQRNWIFFLCNVPIVYLKYIIWIDLTDKIQRVRIIIKVFFSRSTLRPWCSFSTAIRIRGPAWTHSLLLW